MKLVITLLFLVFILLVINTLSRENNSSIVETKPELPKNFEIASWLWKSPDKLSDIEIDTLITKAKQEQINTIYVSIDRYVDITESKNSAKKDELKTFETSLENFIKKANSSDIKIQGLAGDVNWADESHRYIPLKILNFTIDFNKSHDQKLAGMHFDIEFHNQDKYQSEIEVRNQEYLKLVEDLGKIAKDNQDINFELGFDVNPFLDNKNDNNIALQILDKLNNIPNSNMVLMAYRNKADGKNGSIEAIKNEVDYAKTTAPNVKIIIGQETDQNKTENITFYGYSKKYLWQEVLKIIDYYRDNPSIRGVAFHPLPSYLLLE